MRQARDEQCATNQSRLKAARQDDLRRSEEDLRLVVSKHDMV